MNNGQHSLRPSSQQLEEALRRALRLQELRKRILRIFSPLIAVALLITLILTLWLHILRVQGGSSAPTLRDGEVIVFVTTGSLSYGDIIAFRHDGLVLIRRVIAVSGDRVDIDGDGVVMLNGEPLDEPYINIRNAGEISIDLPCRVPDNQFFVIGDNRLASFDSRSSEIGMVNRGDIIGKALIRILPLRKLALLNDRYTTDK